MPAETEPPKSDAGPPKQVLAPKDIHERIIQLVHQALGPDAIILDGQANVKNIVGDMRQDIQKKSADGSSRKKMTGILKRVEYYFKIVDVGIQHQPQVV